MNDCDSLTFRNIYGVDFSGAKLAGRNTWIARLELVPRRRGRPPYVLAELACLEKLCGTAERAASLGHLVERIAASESALWALDFPFGLPIEVMEQGTKWVAQFEFLRAWDGDGDGLGLECIRRAEALAGRKHIRRLTDLETKAPFGPYHYRIIYQTFHGMRDVLGPLCATKYTAILPFQYRRLRWAKRVIVEA